MKIAIIGHGFVGKAVEYGFNSLDNIIIDPKYHNGETYEDNGTPPDFAFVCVPTPMEANGAMDRWPLHVALSRVASKWPNTIIVIKSTVAPQILDETIAEWPDLMIVFNPEFLREASSKEDFANPEFHVFGGDREYTRRVQELYETYSNCRPCPVFHMTAIEASFTKYMVNAFLATKVSFFNEFKTAMDRWNEPPNFNAIIKAVGSDSRIGHSHTRVPGHDGKMGYGGACFPKDVGAIINTEVLPLLSQVQERNNQVRAAAGMTEREVAQNVHFAK